MHRRESQPCQAASRSKSPAFPATTASPGVSSGPSNPRARAPGRCCPRGPRWATNSRPRPTSVSMASTSPTSLRPDANARRPRPSSSFRTNPPSWSPPSWRRRVGAADAETTVTAVEAGDEAEKATVIAAVAEVGTTGVKVAGATTAAVAATVRIARRRPRCPPGPRQSGCAPERPIATRYWRRCRTSSDPLPIS